MLRIARLLSVPLLLGVLTACIEDFERLTTTVTYDPVSRTVRVERVLHNLSADFLGCTDAAACAAAAAQLQRLDYASGAKKPDFGSLLTASDEDRDALAKQMAADMMSGAGDEPAWKTLAKGLVESAAFGVDVKFRRTGDELDAIVTYSAGIDSKAAADTGVALEILRKRGKSSEYLVVDASKSLGGIESKSPPQLVAPTKVLERSLIGAETKTSWVLAPGQNSVTVERYVDEGAQAIFTAIPDLDPALHQAGLL